MSTDAFSIGRRSQFSRLAVWFFFWFLVLSYFELLLHLVVFQELSVTFFYALGFTAAFAGVVALIFSFLPQKAACYVSMGFCGVLAILYGSQMVYSFVFGGLYSLSLVQQGGAALTSFWRETLLTMWHHLPQLLLLFVPLAALLIFRKFFFKFMAPVHHLLKLSLVFVSVLAFLLTLHCLSIGGTGYFSTHHFYYSNETTTEQAVNRFGLLTAMRLELTASVGDDAVVDNSGDYYIPTETAQPSTKPSRPDPILPTEPPVEYNVLDIDFDAISGLTDNQLIQTLNQYCSTLTGTNKNEYTGMLADYNLIYICAESFDTAAIYPELMPTLYKLSTQGIIFNNYYNTYPNVTTDGEYTMCLGLYPDVTRGKKNASFKASKDNYLPFALGNIFTQQKGIQTYGYHNYVGSYYTRKTTHTNMGYAMKFMNDGMRFTTSWPSSDLEMLKQSAADYISQDQFHAYYMTFSGHYAYDTESNLIAARNWDSVKDLSFTNAGKAYLSCHMELEKALAYLMEQLELAGVADKTAIVLAGDHFPYGLTNKQYSQLIGYTIDDFTKFKSSLLFWVGGLEENIIVDEYCCNADILPTVLNLWGFEYDSRMLAGTDIFSDGPHIAILRDYSFYTDKVWFNATNNKIHYLVDESELPEDYIENMIKLVKTKYQISVDILNSNYYDFIFTNIGKKPVT